MTQPPVLAQSTLRQTIRFATAPTRLLTELGARFGEIFQLRLLGSAPWVCLASPDLLRIMYGAAPEVARGGAAAGSVFAELTGWRASLTLDGEGHRRRRRIVQPTLGRARVSAHAAAVRRLTEESMNGWPEGRPFPLHPALRRITLGTILRAVFGVDRDHAGHLAALAGELAERGMSSLLLVAPRLRWDLGRYSPWGRIARLVRLTRAALADEIRRRRRQPTGGGDVLSLLLEARDSQGVALTDEELVDELMALLLAGHETTHLAMAWVFERVLSLTPSHPEAAARIEAEIGDYDDPAEAAGSDYLEAVVKESLRLRPVSPICGGRLLAVPLVIGDYEVPAGMVLTNCSYLLHRRPDLYPDPESFRPARFLSGTAGTTTWTTFGGGDRRCLGSHLAMVEIKVALATVLAAWRLRLARRPVRAVGRGVHLAPAGGLAVIGERRHRNSEPPVDPHTGGRGEEQLGKRPREGAEVEPEGVDPENERPAEAETIGEEP